MVGWLIQAMVGILGGVGRRLQNRRGLAAYAALRVWLRAAWMSVAVPKCIDAGVCNAMPEWRWQWL